nr:VapE domain-containing protein [Thaumasiovibrio subtropicus]
MSFPDLNENAKPLGTAANLKVLLDELGFMPALNKMNLECELLEDGKPLAVSFEVKRSLLVSECLKAGMPKAAIDDHLVALCESDEYHPVAAYLEGDEWDGQQRVSRLIDAMNAKDSNLAQAVMVKWLVACVAAIYEAQFSCKIVPVLQGGQSFKKTAFISRFANLLYGAFLEGAELNPDNKDSVLSCIKSWVVELGELERTSKNSQGSLKAFITKILDTVRPPYARADIKKARQTTFIATVNGSEFLSDDTGSSRYAVIELLSAVDMDAVNSLLGYEYRDGRVTLVAPQELKQFWLEIKAMYDDGASWHLTDAELEMISAINKRHNVKTNWQEFLEDKLDIEDMEGRYLTWMTSAQVCGYFEIQQSYCRQVGKALKVLAADGMIKSEQRRSRATYYEIPVIAESHHP